MTTLCWVQPLALVMLRSTISPFPFSIQTARWFLHSSTTKLSSFIPTSHTHPQQQQQKNQKKQKLLLSFLHNHPTSHKTTQQVHCYLLTTGYLDHQNNCMLHFNALLRCYSIGENPIQALLLYKQLLQFHFLSPSSVIPSFDSFTYSFLIKSSANLFYPILGIQVHALTMKVGFHFHVYVQTALVDMYVACGSLVDAKKVFYEMPERNSVTWNIMITGLVRWGELETACSVFEEMPGRTVVAWTGIIDGYTRVNKPDEAIALFRRMVGCDGIEPSEITILAIFPAISNKGDLKMCQSVHGYGDKRGFCASDIRVTNALIDAYAKCGCILSASRFFEEISTERKNLVSWTSIISAFAMHGMGTEAVDSFERMEKNGLKPNRVTFLSVLNACSHGGLVEEGLKFFEKMANEFQVLPDIKHYGSLIDMLGRAGRLEEAEKMALGIPNDIVNVVIWRILLGACSFHGNVEMGERVTRKVLELERGYGGDYVLMSNIFTGAGRFGDAEKLRNLMDKRNAFKVPGHSLV